MAPKPSLEKQLQQIQGTLAQIHHELKDINSRLDYLLTNFREQFGP